VFTLEQGLPVQIISRVMIIMAIHFVRRVVVISRLVYKLLANTLVIFNIFPVVAVPRCALRFTE
jgi:hypothetical protein